MTLGHSSVNIRVFRFLNKNNKSNEIIRTVVLCSTRWFTHVKEHGNQAMDDET